MSIGVIVPPIAISADEYQTHVERWAKMSRSGAAFPRRTKARLIALHYFQMAFEPERVYSEPQVNNYIKDGNLFDIDHVQIRRYLVDYRMLDRSSNGRSYTTSQEYLSLADWDPLVLQLHRPNPRRSPARER
ncbi:MAG: DUF2087 domain-containing protein [SAR202 cluster bacterium]|nr:DUF2087 domain-containing protein [SAR202 cluster bacterium]